MPVADFADEACADLLTRAARGSPPPCVRARRFRRIRATAGSTAPRCCACAPNPRSPARRCGRRVRGPPRGGPRRGRTRRPRRPRRHRHGGDGGRASGARAGAVVPAGRAPRGGPGRPGCRGTAAAGRLRRRLLGRARRPSRTAFQDRFGRSAQGLRGRIVNDALRVVPTGVAGELCFTAPDEPDTARTNPTPPRTNPTPPRTNPTPPRTNPTPPGRDRARKRTPRPAAPAPTSATAPAPAPAWATAPAPAPAPAAPGHCCAPASAPGSPPTGRW
ncbi:hypothetical protein NKH77_44585 [Streptomyces sp. M19]